MINQPGIAMLIVVIRQLVTVLSDYLQYNAASRLARPSHRCQICRETSHRGDDTLTLVVQLDFFRGGRMKERFLGAAGLMEHYRSLFTFGPS